MMDKQHHTHHVINERDHIRRMKQPWTNFKDVKQSQVFIEAMNMISLQIPTLDLQLSAVRTQR